MQWKADAENYSNHKEEGERIESGLSGGREEVHQMLCTDTVMHVQMARRCTSETQIILISCLRYYQLQLVSDTALPRSDHQTLLTTIASAMALIIAEMIILSSHQCQPNMSMQLHFLLDCICQ